MLEKTLSIIKPDGVSKGLIGEIIRTFEKNSIKIIAMKMLWLSEKEARGFYQIHKDKPFFESLIKFMTSGPCVVMVLEGNGVIEKNRKLMGATDPKKADKGTIRNMYAFDIEKNIVHGSDSTGTAKWEINYFFNQSDILTNNHI